MSLWSNITGLNSWANECRLLLVDLEDDLDMRSISDYNLTGHGGVGWVAIANRRVLVDLIEAMQWFVYGLTSSFSYVKWLNVHQGLYEQESEITWQAITEAWIKDDFEGRAVTIALIDRMRQILWDEPFYAVFAGHPEETEF